LGRAVFVLVLETIGSYVDAFQSADRLGRFLSVDVIYFRSNSLGEIEKFTVDIDLNDIASAGLKTVEPVKVEPGRVLRAACNDRQKNEYE